MTSPVIPHRQKPLCGSLVTCEWIQVTTHVLGVVLQSSTPNTPVMTLLYSHRVPTNIYNIFSSSYGY